MNSIINIIVDVSGSMNEIGKIHLQRNLCRYAAQLRLIDQEKCSGSDIRFYQWAQNISEVVLQSDGDIPALNAEGSSNLCGLSSFFSKKKNDKGKVRILILSDGNFDRDDYKAFLGWKKESKLLLIRTVAVGSDADLLKLQKISTNNRVYLAENIASAIENTIFGSDVPFSKPTFLSHILQQSEPIKMEEPEEDWDA